MLTFYHSPWTRATGVRTLLEELEAPYDMRLVNRKAGEQRSPEFLAINPLGKVPTIAHDGAVITEQVAIYLYLADQFPEKGLAPAIGDKLRGPYLRWMAIYGAAFEPALVDHYRKTDPGSPGMSPYGTFDGVLDLLESQLATGPFLFGYRLTAADILWGSALGWTIQFGLVPKRPAFVRLQEAVASRPAARKVFEEDKTLAETYAPKMG